MKKLISILLSICILLTAVSALCFTAYAQERKLSASGESEGSFEYSVSDGKATVTGYSGSPTELVISSPLDGCPVTNIGNFAFWYCNSLSSNTLPDSLTDIGERAFDGCISLTSINIPDSVTIIGGTTFYRCTSHQSVIISDLIKEIGVAAFYGCPALQ